MGVKLGLSGCLRIEIRGKYLRGIQRDWRKLRNEELHDLYLWLVNVQLAKSRRMELGGALACMGDERNAYGLLVGKAEVEKPLGRPGIRWEEDIKMYIKT